MYTCLLFLFFLLRLASKINSMAWTQFGRQFAESRNFMNTLNDRHHSARDDEESDISYGKAHPVILLSHIPLYKINLSLRKEIFKSLRPRVVISADRHTAGYVAYQLSTGNFHQDVQGTEFVDVRLFRQPKQSACVDDCVVDITAPTCSYRMGTTTMGLSIADFGKS